MVDYVVRGTAGGGGFLTTRLHAKHGVFKYQIWSRNGDYEIWLRE